MLSHPEQDPIPGQVLRIPDIEPPENGERFKESRNMLFSAKGVRTSPAS